jgi:hypothetical protein
VIRQVELSAYRALVSPGAAAAIVEYRQQGYLPDGLGPALIAEDHDRSGSSLHDNLGAAEGVLELDSGKCIHRS